MHKCAIWDAPFNQVFFLSSFLFLFFLIYLFLAVTRGTGSVKSRHDDMPEFSEELADFQPDTEDMYGSDWLIVSQNKHLGGGNVVDQTKGYVQFV